MPFDSVPEKLPLHRKDLSPSLHLTDLDRSLPVALRKLHSGDMPPDIAKTVSNMCSSAIKAIELARAETPQKPIPLTLRFDPFDPDLSDPTGQGTGPKGGKPVPASQGQRQEYPGFIKENEPNDSETEG